MSAAIHQRSQMWFHCHRGSCYWSMHETQATMENMSHVKQLRRP